MDPLVTYLISRHMDPITAITRDHGDDGDLFFMSRLRR
jgi:hypothetical protein